MTRSAGTLADVVPASAPPDARRHRVLVTDAEQRAALAAIRALGRRGHVVHVVSRRARSIGGASRYAAASAQVPDALAAPAAYVEAIRELVDRWRVDVVLPMTDDSHLALLPERHRLGGAVVPAVDVDTYRAVSDKALVHAAAARQGIAVPEQYVVEYVDRGRVPLETLRYPLVAKPSRTVGAVDGRLERVGVRHARDARELADILGTWGEAAFPLLLQRRVIGPGVGIFLLIWDGEVVATFAHRRLREKPPSGGVSVYRESIPAEPRLVERSRALLDHFGWRGVAMIEYKIDAATGTPYLMEINGRFWGSLQLAIDAGVDFPNLLLAVAVDGARPRVSGYRCGVRSRWWWGDVDQLLLRLRHSDRSLALAADASSRWAAILDFLKLWRPRDRSEVLRISDPWPAVVESIAWFRRE